MNNVKLLQITTAAFGLLTVVLAFLLLDVYGEIDRLESERAGGNGAAVNGSGAGRTDAGKRQPVAYEGQDLAGLRKQVTELSAEVERLEQETAKLQNERKALARKVKDQEAEMERLEGGGSGGSNNGGPSDVPFKDPEIPMGSGVAPPSYEELEAIAGSLDLSSDQMKQVYRVIRDGRESFNKELARLQKQGGSLDDLLAEGRRISQEMQDRIRQLLPPEKADPFTEYVQKVFETDGPMTAPPR